MNADTLLCCALFQQQSGRRRRSAAAAPRMQRAATQSMDCRSLAEAQGSHLHQAARQVLIKMEF